MKKLSAFIVIALSFLLVNNLFADKSTSPASAIVSAEGPDEETSFTSISNPCGSCNSCFPKDKGIEMPFKELPFVLFALAVIIIVFFKRHKLKILFWTIGVVCFAGLSYEASVKHIVPKNKSSNEIIIDGPQEQSRGKKVETINEIEGKSYAGEKLTSEDEFFSLEDEGLDRGAGADDEFGPIDQEDEFVSLDDGDGFTTLPDTENVSASEGHSGTTLKNWMNSSDGKAFQRTFLALVAVILAAMAFKFNAGRRFRTIFLLLSLLYFGFYTSGCPCMISSFQSLILLLLGEKVVWVSIIWITGLLFLSYFFGRIWCGWVCHLGALQEFLYKPGKLKVTLNQTVQKIFHVVRVIAFIALILQLIYTRINLYIKIDPFKVAFNMFSTNTTGYVLLAILIISSFFIYRPFCRSLCPVGLFFGWLAYIPGASVLQIGSDCKSCKKCMKQCDCQAISQNLDSYQLNNDDCIRCGDCIDACNFKAVHKK